MLFALFIVTLSAVTGEITEPVDFLSDDYIEHLNKQDLPWLAGRNFPADLTQSDVERIFGTPPQLGAFPESPAPEERRVTHKLTAAGPPIPPEFDARKHFKECEALISVIPDQGACASSYAFAITSVASDRLCVASHGKVKRLLSAEYVTSCCKMCRYPDEKKLCSSGLSSATWTWINKRGLVTGGGYNSHIGCQPVSFPTCNHTPVSNSQPSCNTMPAPQPKCHTRCTNSQYSRGFFHDKNRFKKYYWLSEQVPDIQREILEHGPVAANMYLYSDLLSYKSGVYTVSSSATILAYTTVKIIGWGEENGKPFWLVVSNFGDKFGRGGTFKILRGHNEAIIESLVNAALPRGSFDYALASASNAEKDDEDDGFEFVEDL